MKKARLLQWVVFFSWHFTLNGPLFLQFLLSKIINNGAQAYEVVFLHHLRNSTGPKGTPLENFWLWETFFEKNSQRVPLQFFGVFWQNGCWKIAKGFPFQFCRHCGTFSHFFLTKKAPFNFFDDLRQNGWTISKSPQFNWTFVFFGYSRREYFHTLKFFCYFWALDMVPTWEQWVPMEV